MYCSNKLTLPAASQALLFKDKILRSPLHGNAKNCTKTRSALSLSDELLLADNEVLGCEDESLANVIDQEDVALSRQSMTDLKEPVKTVALMCCT